MSESLITKRAIADSLKELTRSKTFDKISVKDITENCGINRQTFYYHFEDKFKLLEWIYENDLLEKPMAEVDFDNWPEKMEDVLTIMTSDKYFYINTISHTENYIQTYLLGQAQTLFEQAIDKLDEKGKVNDAERNYIARFFAHGICGKVTEWVLKGMEETPEFVTSNMRNMLISCSRAAYLHINEITQ
jgi:probable dihydroxyacetone kinase regulator